MFCRNTSRILELALCVALSVFSCPAFARPISECPYKDYFLGSSDDAETWTKDDVAAMCRTENPGALSSRDCIQRNIHKIGHHKTPGDTAMLTAAEQSVPDDPNHLPKLTSQ